MDISWFSIAASVQADEIISKLKGTQSKFIRAGIKSGLKLKISDEREQKKRDIQDMF